jgi:hypothetical protein
MNIDIQVNKRACWSCGMRRVDILMLVFCSVSREAQTDLCVQ